VNQSIRIVIGALGGEGGGVLVNWVAETASREGFLSQATSVAGVAQRTGAPIYYLEIFPRADAEAAGKPPVMSMFPAPGDVDIVVCSEIVEAGRLIQRGFCTPDRTVLITSTHRTYGITEKEAMGSGVADKEAIAGVARANARAFVGFDMLEITRRHDTVISAALFGALAGADVLPFPREAFEQTVRDAGIAVDSNLATFAGSFAEAAAQRHQGVQDAAQYDPQAAVQVVEPPRDAAIPEPAGGVTTPGPPDARPFSLPEATTAEGGRLLARIADYPADCQEILYLGCKKLVHYQDHAYAHDYLVRVDSIRALEKQGSTELTRETARFLALWMAFEDLPRVAQIKISRERFQRFRDEVRAADDQQVGMVEFLHPRVEEFCGAMPAVMGRYTQNSRVFSWLLGLMARPRNVRTNSLHGYIMLYLMAKMRRLRRRTLIFQIEHTHIRAWLDAVRTAADRDYDTAVELARCGRLIKGYGSTRERGNASMERILALYGRVPDLGAADIARLREAALSDEEGEAFTDVEVELEQPAPREQRTAATA